MNAHLREKANEKRFATRLHRRNGDAIARTRMPSLLHLGQQYDTQARDNFIKEAVLFALIVAASGVSYHSKRAGDDRKVVS